jgi:hypothetical protein
MVPALAFFVRRRESLIEFFAIKEPNFFEQLGLKKGCTFRVPTFSESSDLYSYLNQIQNCSEKLSTEKKVSSTRVISFIHKITNLTCFSQRHTFTRLSQLLSKPTVWSKAAFFQPKGRSILTSLSSDSSDLLAETRNALLVDLAKISQEIAGNSQVDSSNPFLSVGFQSSTLSRLEDYLNNNESTEFNVLQFYSVDIFPKLSATNPHDFQCLSRLLSLLFSIPATQVACERVFSTASRTFDPMRSSMSSITLSALVIIQRIFPNSTDGILRALNAVRDLRTSLQMKEKEGPPSIAEID